MSENGQEKKPVSEKYYQAGSSGEKGAPKKASRSVFRNEDFEQDLTVDLEKAKTTDFATVKPSREGAGKKANKALHNSQSHSQKGKNSSSSRASQNAPSPNSEKAAPSDKNERVMRLRPSRDGYSQKERDASKSMTKVISKVSETVSTQNEKRKKRRTENVSAQIRKNRRLREMRKRRFISSAHRSPFLKFFLGLFEEHEASFDSKSKLHSLFERLSAFCYTNRLSKFLHKMHLSFAFCEARHYGAFLLTFGLFVLLGHLSALFLNIPYSDTSYLSSAAGLACVVISLPLIFSRRTISHVLENSFITDLLFFRFLGARKQNRKDEIKVKLFYPVAYGIFLGLCAFIVSPVKILAILLLALFVGFVIASPEFGITSAALLLPFLTYLRHPTVIVCAFILLCYVSYLRKLLLKKRSFRLSPCDLFVLIFMLFYLGGGLVSYAKGLSSFENSIVFCCIISVYFLSSNLLINKRIIGTFMRAMLLSGMIISFLGIYQQLSGNAVADWLDVAAFADIAGRVSSTFDNPNVFASYLIMIIPFVFVPYRERPSFVSVVFKLFAFALLIAALVFTWSRGAWLGLIVSLLCFAIFRLRKSPKIFALIFTFIPNLLLLAPRSVTSRFSSIFSFLDTNVDSSVSYRFTVWKDSLQLFKNNLFGGVGVGPDAFHNAYRAFSSIGAETVEHSHNLYLQIGIELGIFALLTFALILLFTCKNCFSLEFSTNESSVHPVCAAAFCSVLALLTNGLTDYVWYNYRVCFLFWLLLGLCTASYRIGLSEQRQRDYLSSLISNKATLDVQISK